MGWWPSKIVVILNLIQMIGYSLIDCVVGGQILSAVSPHGSMSVAVGMYTDIVDDELPLTLVGIVIIAIISWVIATIGIKIFHYYERFVLSMFTSCQLLIVSDSRSSPSSS